MLGGNVEGIYQKKDVLEIELFVWQYIYIWMNLGVIQNFVGGLYMLM